MARPVYILCARAASEDRSTGFVSVFQLMETVELWPPRPSERESDDPRRRAEKPIEASELVIYANWMAGENDAGVMFEHQFRINVLGKVREASASTFQFEPDKPLYRFRMNFHGFPTPKESGVVYFESRIRPLGEVPWMSQDYPVFVTVHQPADTNSS
jgi:hypothetical protein